jgi:uncharacterized protein (DUF934 family)
MRKIIRNGAIVIDDWQHLDDAASVPATGKVIVSCARWQSEKEFLRLRRGGSIGIRIGGDQVLDALVPDLPELGLIALEFALFRDGRCLSHARVLREQLGYQGELRAIGDVLRDQMFYMQRVGINAFEPRADRPIEEALNGLRDFSAAYQPAADGWAPAWRRRTPSL